MFLESLTLHQYKNHHQFSVSFASKLNGIVGENGKGKTNLLDAIYFLCLTKSAFHNSDALCIETGQTDMAVEGMFSIDNKPIKVSGGLLPKKSFFMNQKPYEKLSEHIGRLPVVLISPNDTDLVREGSEERRRFFDAVLCQLHHQYLEAYQMYNKHLEARNKVLKTHHPDRSLLDYYTQPLIKSGLVIQNFRKAFIGDFQKRFATFYRQLSENREAVSIEYESQVSQENYEELFNKALEKDLILQRTTVGVHRDKFHFLIDEKPLKQFGSQGQQKAVIMALKFGQFEVLFTEKKHKPLLLLDDLFDKLDNRRIQQILKMIEEGFFGQVFITDANPDRFALWTDALQIDKKLIEL